MSAYYKKRVISPAEENISLDVYKNHNKNLLKEFVMTVEDVPELRKNYLVGKTYMMVGAGLKIPYGDETILMCLEEMKYKM
jgi:hypothetical protein